MSLGHLRTAAIVGHLGHRQLSWTTSASAIKRLPSFAEIKSVRLDDYRKKDETSTKETLERVREGITTEVPDTSKGSGLIKSFLYGSPKVKEEHAEMEKSFSQFLARGKYVHEIVTHRVKPDRASRYLEAVTKMYPKVANNPVNKVHLVGSWRHVVGDMDTYTHIWEYNGYTGFHQSQNEMHQDEEYLEFLAELRDCVRSRESSLMQEFSFWGGTAAPRTLGGVFELRTYDLQPGKLMEWEQHWQQGIKVRRQVMEPVGAWFSSLGQLNRVHHLWQFADLEHRRLCREKCWELPGWAETTHETVKLIDNMSADILVPLSFSPLK